VIPERAGEAALVSVELPEEVWDELEIEYRRRRAESNPSTITFNEFQELCIVAGLERLQQLSAEEALALVEELGAHNDGA